MAVGRGGEPLDQAEIDAVLSGAQAAPEPAAAPPPPAVFAPLDEPGLPDGIEAQNLDIVMDIPLEVSVELGRKRMSIRDILDLGSGSIVELDKIAGEPVDLLVNGRLVARGEVVVIEDNFGVRITEIVGPAGRGDAPGRNSE